VTSADGLIEYEYGSYDVPGVEHPVYGVMCHPIDAGTAPLRTVIWNHGGLRTPTDTTNIGLTSADLDWCHDMAARHWRVAMSTYRYLGVTNDGSLSIPSELIASIPSALGRPSEFCLGEVTDVLRWTEIVRARSDTNDNEMLMIGGSHGGCVTLRAVEQGARVKAAIALAGPADFVAWYDDGVARFGAAAIDQWAPHFGGGGSILAPRDALTARSAVRMAVDIERRNDVKVMLVASFGDIFVPPKTVCQLAGLLGTANYFVNSDGLGEPVEPGGPTGLTIPAEAYPECSALSWATSASGSDGWTGNRYFMLYQSVVGDTHGQTFWPTPWPLMPGDSTMDAPLGAFITAIFGD